MMGGVLEANAASSSHIPILLFIKKTHHPSNPNTVLFAISRRKSSPSQLFCRRLENRCSVLCHATRRKPRYDSSDNDDEEEYGHNSEISMLEFYSECNRDVALLVGATVDGEEEQVIIFKGFSSLLSSGTFWDPSKSVLPARAKIRCVDIVKGPFDPSMVEYLETNLTPDDFKTRLKNTLNSDKNTSLSIDDDSLPCLLFFVCMRDTFIPEGRKLEDPRRLYAPGRIYHIVERKLCRCGRYPPVVRTAIPVEGRFEHIVLSSNATKDHAIIWIERESEKALVRMKEKAGILTPPSAQKMVRMQTLKQEHKQAIERTVSLNVPHMEGLQDECNVDDGKEEEGGMEMKPNAKLRWDELVSSLFEQGETGQVVLKNHPPLSEPEVS